MKPLVPAVTYQGAKQRIAVDVVDRLIAGIRPFYDVCCGSGAISIELVNRGVSPTDIHMVDQSPWGLVWRTIGNGTFDLATFKRHIDAIPADATLIQGFIKELSKQPAHLDTPYVFLLLQASSFGGKAIWIENDVWKNCSFRNYWLPTATSNRRSPVNPMMPMPNTLYERAARLVEGMHGVVGYHVDAMTLTPTGTVYVDPPYLNTTAYGHTLDVLAFVKRCDGTCYVSEGKPMSDSHELIASGRDKGGISGERKKANEEWLSIFPEFSRGEL